MYKQCDCNVRRNKKILSKMFTVRLNTVTYTVYLNIPILTPSYFLPQCWWNALLFRKHIASVHFRLVIYLNFVCHFWNLPTFYDLIVVLVEDVCNCWCISREFFPILRSCFRCYLRMCLAQVLICDICWNAGNGQTDREYFRCFLECLR